MNCGFDVWKAGSAALAPGSPELGIICVDARTCRSIAGPSSTTASTPWAPGGRARPGSGAAVAEPVKTFAAAVDAMGHASAKAQGLGAVITTTAKLVSSDHRLYLAVSSDRVTLLGLLKVGPKHLFIRNESGVVKEIDPLCVLDFYVSEACQRQGIGQRMFEYMLAREGQSAVSLGYDRPSPKFIAFLAKHYGLRDYTPQANNFVVFKQYFAHSGSGPSAPGGRGGSGGSSGGGGGGPGGLLSGRGGPSTAAAPLPGASSSFGASFSRHRSSMEAAAAASGDVGAGGVAAAMGIGGALRRSGSSSGLGFGGAGGGAGGGTGFGAAGSRSGASGLGEGSDGLLPVHSRAIAAAFSSSGFGGGSGSSSSGGGSGSGSGGGSGYGSSRFGAPSAHGGSGGARVSEPAVVPGLSATMGSARDGGRSSGAPGRSSILLSRPF